MCVSFIIDNKWIENCGQLSEVVDPDLCWAEENGGLLKPNTWKPEECLCWIDQEKLAKVLGLRIVGPEGDGWEVRFEDGSTATTGD